MNADLSGVEEEANLYFAIVLQHSDVLIQGLWMTVKLSIVILIIGTPLALVVALARISNVKLLCNLASVYSRTIRAIPALVILYFGFYALPAFGLRLRALHAAILGLVIAAVAYISEDLRAGLLAVPSGQFLAAKSLGMSYGHMIRKIILPQVIPVALPSYMTRAILIVKGTSLASIVGVSELTGEAAAQVSLTYRALEFLSVAAVLYLLLTGILALLQIYLERRFSVP